jgi:predicted naringenin-chalcone synthase
MTMTILGLGLAKPPTAITQPDAVAMARTRCCQRPREARLLETIYRQTSVRQRGSVLLTAAGDVSAATPGSPPPPPTSLVDADDPPPEHPRASFDGFYGEPTSGAPRGPGVADRMIEYARQAPRLAEAAAREALLKAQCSAEQIDQLVIVSCTGAASPGVDFALIEQMGLRPDVGRTLIGFQGCHGAINGLRVSEALAAARPGDTVLQVCVELCSLHFQYGWNPQQVVANALFADGAAAVVGRAALTGSPSGSPPHPKTTATRWQPVVRGTGSCVLPDSRGDMTWTIGDHGFEMSLSPRVPSLIRKHLRPWLKLWLARHGLSPHAVAGWVIHPGGPRIVDATADALDLPAAAVAESRRVLAEHGNMSSPTVLFILDRLREKRVTGPCVMLAYGPGLVVEAALLDC